MDYFIGLICVFLFVLCIRWLRAYLRNTKKITVNKTVVKPTPKHYQRKYAPNELAPMGKGSFQKRQQLLRKRKTVEYLLIKAFAKAEVHHTNLNTPYRFITITDIEGLSLNDTIEVLSDESYQITHGWYLMPGEGDQQGDDNYMRVVQNDLDEDTLIMVEDKSCMDYKRWTYIIRGITEKNVYNKVADAILKVGYDDDGLSVHKMTRLYYVPATEKIGNDTRPASLQLCATNRKPTPKQVYRQSGNWYFKNKEYPSKGKALEAFSAWNVRSKNIDISISGTPEPTGPNANLERSLEDNVL